MSLLIAACCFVACGFLIWKIRSYDHDSEVPGPISHVIIPAAVLPVICLLSVIALIALAVYFGLLQL